MGEGKVYSLAEVSEHNNSKDCWLIIDGKVLDLGLMLLVLRSLDGSGNVIMDIYFFVWVIFWGFVKFNFWSFFMGCFLFDFYSIVVSFSFEYILMNFEFPFLSFLMFVCVCDGNLRFCLVKAGKIWNLSTQICVSILFFACKRSVLYCLVEWKDTWCWFYLFNLLHCITFSNWFFLLVHCMSLMTQLVIHFSFVGLKISRL